MADSLFTDESKTPTKAELATTLGNTKNLRDELKNVIAERFNPVAEEWAWSGKSYGWSLRLKQKKRAILYMKPCKGYFRASFALGEKAIIAAQTSDLPNSALDLINTAPKFPEGRAGRLEIKSKKDINIAIKIAEIKMAN
jgi:hypothetical protein